jgi:hypothetical protein
MTQGQKRTALDEVKKGEILALLSVGCSRRMAARCVGCSPSTIPRTALRDREFAKRLGRATLAAQVGYLKRIQKASQKEQYWRAAAWALERLNPDDFGPRSPDTVTLVRIKEMMTTLGQLVVEELPNPADRKHIIAGVSAMLAELDAESKEDGGSDEKRPGNA